MSKVAFSQHARVINELKATGYHVGLLLNFDAPSLEQQRFIRPARRDVLSPSLLREDKSSYDIAPPPVIFF